MLKWAAIFFVVALIAALFGFSGIAGAAAEAVLESEWSKNLLIPVT